MSRRLESDAASAEIPSRLARLDSVDAAREAIRRIVLRLQAERGRKEVCIEATGEVSRAFPCEVEPGEYVGPEVPQVGSTPYGHHWLRLDDGTILDVTADQFGDDDCVRVVPLGDPRQRYYLNDTGLDDLDGYPFSRFFAWSGVSRSRDGAFTEEDRAESRRLLAERDGRIRSLRSALARSPGGSMAYER